MLVRAVFDFMPCPILGSHFRDDSEPLSSRCSFRDVVTVSDHRLCWMMNRVRYNIVDGALILQSVHPAFLNIAGPVLAPAYTSRLTNMISKQWHHDSDIETLYPKFGGGDLSFV